MADMESMESFEQLHYALEELPDVAPQNPADHAEVNNVCLITLNGGGPISI
ncbi:hypothetical protein AB0C81_06055 [Streptomyces roseoverticillatus]|uniref:hypothetical protein n=1 Tax=Streptomyces roseoverticillatus TaxID=66429 RepID=UPI0033E30965